MVAAHSLVDLRERGMMPTWTCDYCHQEWRSPISAALCCDTISNDHDDDAPGRTRYELGYD